MRGRLPASALFEKGIEFAYVKIGYANQCDPVHCKSIPFAAWLPPRSRNVVSLPKRGLYRVAHFANSRAGNRLSILLPIITIEQLKRKDSVISDRLEIAKHLP